ncbi:MAG: tol-pal system protein YbgF [candidate division WOR-3 bacterium]
MAASSLSRRTASVRMFGFGLLAAFIFPGCSLYREYVRRGQVADSLVARIDRLEQAQFRQSNQLATLRADVLNETDKLETRLSQVDASIRDLNDRLDRISRRLGVGYGNLSPAADSASGTTGTQVPTQPQRTPVRDTQLLGVDPDRLYNDAYLDFTRGKYDVAIDGFRHYLELFPESEMADNALYWLGECHYSQGRLDSAETAFREVLTRYRNANKAPAAGYKLALVYEAQGRSVDARRQLTEVVERYPGTTEARLAQERLSQKR